VLLSQDMYKFLRSFLFLFDPEQVHYFSMNCLKLLCKFSQAKNLLSKNFTPPTDACQAFNLAFKNRVGLGAGFDKNATYLDELEALGFGFVEIGTVTPRPQAGNEKPRLFRLEKDRALLNRMGFNNDGVTAIAGRLKAWRERKSATLSNRLIIGGNIGKNKDTANDEAWQDYATCFTALHPYVDYFVVNVSSPNTPGLRELQEKDSLRKILTTLQALNKQQSSVKPLLLKIAPDLNREQLADVAALAMEIKLDGIVASNTTISRDALTPTSKLKAEQFGPGGISGAPVKNRSTEVVKHLYDITGGKIPVIASGGIFTGSDAREKITAGATLVQVWTGFIYEGPSIVKSISTYLAASEKKSSPLK
jgi:dihydroorotate dehydrogenase